MKRASFSSIIRIFFRRFLRILWFRPISKAFLSLRSAHMRRARASVGEESLFRLSEYFFAGFLEFYSLGQFPRLSSPSDQLTGGTPELAEVKRSYFSSIIRIFFRRFLRILSFRPISKAFLSLRSAHRRRARASWGEESLFRLSEYSFAGFLEFCSLGQFPRLSSPSDQLTGGTPELAEVKRVSFDYSNIFRQVSFSLGQFPRLSSSSDQLTGGAPELANVKVLQAVNWLLCSARGSLRSPIFCLPYCQVMEHTINLTDAEDANWYTLWKEVSELFNSSCRFRRFLNCIFLRTRICRNSRYSRE